MQVEKLLLMIYLGAVFVGFMQEDGQWNAWTPPESCATTGACNDDKDCKTTVLDETKLKQEGCIESATIVAPGGPTVFVRCEVKEGQQVCTYERDDGLDNQIDRAGTNTCRQEKSVEECTWTEDVENDGDVDSIISEHCEEKNGFTECRRIEDRNADGVIDYERTTTENCKQQGNQETCIWTVEDSEDIHEEGENITTCKQQGDQEICKSSNAHSPVGFSTWRTCQQVGNAEICVFEFYGEFTKSTNFRVCVQQMCHDFEDRPTVTTEGLCSNEGSS